MTCQDCIFWVRYSRKREGNYGRCKNIDSAKNYEINLKVIDTDKPTNISHVVLSTKQDFGCKDFSGLKNRRRRALVRWLVKKAR